MKTLKLSLFCTFLFLNFIKLATSETASFFGSSYITVPLQEAKSTTELSLKFRTNQSDALLFLAAGRTDYCLVKLQSGKLKVYINLGAGESEISFPKGLRLDDLAWHQVDLYRNQVDVNVTIDDFHHYGGKLSGRFFELNIYDGIFLGGIDDSLDLFLGHFGGLRGCMSSVIYNGLDLLNLARFRKYSSDAYGIRWTCALEFDASISDDISFVDDGAYIAFPTRITRADVLVTFEMKTMERNGLLLYYSKILSAGKIEFLALGLMDANITLYSFSGSGGAEVNADYPMDGNWHAITISSGFEIGIWVDKNYRGLSPPSAPSKHSDLSETLYVGGVELSKQAGALARMKTADTSFKGCIRNFRINNVLQGIGNAKVTQGILPSCFWNYRCKEKECNDDHECRQKGPDGQKICNSKYAPIQRIKMATEMEIINVNRIQVLEGGTITITNTDLDVIVDYKRYNLQEDQVVFSIIAKPQGGTVFVEGIIKDVFTFADLMDHKVTYLHHGGEEKQDQFVVKLTFEPYSNVTLPRLLQNDYSLNISIDVDTINDPPQLMTPNFSDIVVAQNSKKVMTREYLNATDPDNDDTTLTYNIQYYGEQGGHFEYIRDNGIKLVMFSQAEVDSGQIAYVQNDYLQNDTKVDIEVTDGTDASSTITLGIKVIQLQFIVANLTELLVVPGHSSLITTSHLAFKSNFDGPDIVITYFITESPKLGQILSEEGNTSLIERNSFTDREISDGKIHYSHNDKTKNASDSFQFSVGRTSPPQGGEVYKFSIKMVQPQLKIIKRKNEVAMDYKRTVYIEQSHIEADTYPHSTPVDQIIYEVVGESQIGYLSVRHSTKTENIKRFTQGDINEGEVEYILNFNTVTDFEDIINFRVSASNFVSTTNIVIKYKASIYGDQLFQVVSKPVQVPEGGQQPLLTENINVIANHASEMTYKLLKGPFNGWLELMDSDHTKILKKNITIFTKRDIANQAVIYIHDNSETAFDNFTFIAYSTPNVDFQYVGMLKFDITLRNDNQPLCKINTNVRMQTVSKKLISKKHVSCEDIDHGSTPSSISFKTNKLPPDCAFVTATKPHTVIDEFTQDDINNQKVAFRYTGEDESLLVITLNVSDGLHEHELTLYINATKNFIRICTNASIISSGNGVYYTDLIVMKGGYSYFTLDHLCLESDSMPNPKDVRYIVAQYPTAGVLALNETFLSKDVDIKFSQEDLENGRFLAYKHNGSEEDKDEIVITWGNTPIKAMIVVRLKIYPASYWEALKVVNGNYSVIPVEEGTSYTITENVLKVVGNNVNENKIKYIVKDAPSFGYLTITYRKKYEGEIVEEGPYDNYINEFTQQDIVDHKIRFLQVTPNSANDKIVLEVTNGVVSIKNLTLFIEIIPEKFFVDDGHMELKEGTSHAIKLDLFSIPSAYFRDRINVIELRDVPKHGNVRNLKDNTMIGVKEKWTRMEMDSGNILYEHDGSNTVDDMIILTVYAGDYQAIGILHITIEQENDEVPVIVVNKPLITYSFAAAPITTDNLMAKDNDSIEHDLHYEINNVRCGYVTVSDDKFGLSMYIMEFRQHEIEKRQVIFVTGDAIEGMDCGMDVVVSDGKHKSPVSKFSVIIDKPKLHLSGTHSITIEPFFDVAITSDALLAWSDLDENPMYFIKEGPKHGYLKLGQSQNPINFTQSDINNTLVHYQHTDYSFKDPMLIDDWFIFDVISSRNKTVNQAFKIELKSHEIPDTSFLTRRIDVIGGKDVDLTSFLMDLEPVWLGSMDITVLKIVDYPKYGLICFNRHCNKHGAKYDELVNGVIKYIHDGSYTTQDNATFAWIKCEVTRFPYDICTDDDALLRSNLSVVFDIRQPNDKPLKIIQPDPSLTVVQGMKFVFTKKELETVDGNTKPEDIVYEIVSGPSIGSIIVGGVKDAVKFTQEDIYQKQVIYEHSGPIISTSFHFRVSDGNSNPIYKVFNILVEKATLKVTAGRTIGFMQGESSTLISTVTLRTETNMNVGDLIFKITEQPRYGQILKNGTQVDEFIYKDLEEDLIKYQQITMFQTAGDQIGFEAYHPNLEFLKVQDLKLNVEIYPSVKSNPLVLFTKGKKMISTNELDAGHLESSSNSDPLFQIIKFPTKGNITKVIKESGKSKKWMRKVSEFSYSDVKAGAIFYITAENDNFEDSVGLNVSIVLTNESIKTIQTAILGLEIVMRKDGPKDDDRPPYETHAKESTKVDDDGRTSELEEMEIITPNMTDDYTFVLSLFLLVVLISLFVVYWIRRRTIKMEEDETKICPHMPLPCPPDDMTTPTIHPFTSTPHCKIIPLIADSATSSERDYNLGYPYGTYDEEWTNFDQSESSGGANGQPMLRKNQYWV